MPGASGEKPESTQFSKPLTIQAIADQLGIHKSTVSLVLSGKGRISPATRDRIMALVREHGYAPDPFAQRLASRTHHKTVYVCSGTLDPGLGTEKVALLQTRLTGLGLDVPISTPARRTEGDQHSVESQIELFRNLRRLRPQAIVCSVFRFHEDAIAELEKYQKDGGIVVAYDLPIPLACDQVIFDREDNAYQGMRYLLERGHRQIGLGVSQRTRSQNWQSNYTQNQRLAGFQRALREWGVEAPDWIVENASYNEGGEVMAREFLTLQKRPTALCIVNDQVILGFMTHILRAGLAVPRELSIMGHENQTIARFCPVPLTSISQPLEDIVEAVAELVMQRLAGSDVPPQTVSMRGRLVEGGSVADGPEIPAPRPIAAVSAGGQEPTRPVNGAHVRLSAVHRAQLEKLLTGSSTSARARQRAEALLELSGGRSLREVASQLGISYNTIVQWRDNYRETGLAFLQDKARPGRPPQISDAQRSQIVALASAPPPEGHGQWSSRLLAEKAVELNLVEHISHNQVAKILREAKG